MITKEKNCRGKTHTKANAICKAYLAGLDYKEIIYHLGVSKDTVSNTIYEAKKSGLLKEIESLYH